MGREKIDREAQGVTIIRTILPRALPRWWKDRQAFRIYAALKDAGFIKKRVRPLRVGASPLPPTTEPAKQLDLPFPTAVSTSTNLTNIS